MELNDAEEAMGIRKILPYDIRMKRNPQTKKGYLLYFYGFSWCYASPKSNLYPRMEILSMASLTPKYATTFANTLVLTDFSFKKTLTLPENLLNYMGRIWVGSNHLKVF